jgi:lipid-A-disaccharide synthase-like uncharacterized protein
MCFWKSVLGIRFTKFYLVIVFQVLSVMWQTLTSPSKLQVSRFVLLWHTSHNVPEEFYHCSIFTTAIILCYRFQKRDVCLLWTANPILKVAPLHISQNLKRDDHLHTFLNPWNLLRILFKNHITSKLYKLL